MVKDLAAWSSFRVLASVRGEPAAVGGCTLRGEVAQLWGAVTVREYRRRGAYRAVLAERLRLAPRPRRHASPGERARGDVGPDPAPVRVRRLQRGALLLAAAHIAG